MLCTQCCFVALAFACQDGSLAELKQAAYEDIRGNLLDSTQILALANLQPPHQDSKRLDRKKEGEAWHKDTLEIAGRPPRSQAALANKQQAVSFRAEGHLPSLSRNAQTRLGGGRLRQPLSKPKAASPQATCAAPSDTSPTLRITGPTYMCLPITGESVRHRAWFDLSWSDHKITTPKNRLIPRTRVRGFDFRKLPRQRGKKSFWKLQPH